MIVLDQVIRAIWSEEQEKFCSEYSENTNQWRGA